MSHNIIAFGKHWCQRRLLKHEGHKARRGCYLPTTMKRSAGPGCDFYMLACNTGLFPGNVWRTRAPPKITGSIKVATKASLVASSSLPASLRRLPEFQITHPHSPLSQMDPKHAKAPTLPYKTSALTLPQLRLERYCGPRCQSEQHREAWFVSELHKVRCLKNSM